jgi:hypothetical protein
VYPRGKTIWQKLTSYAVKQTVIEQSVVGSQKLYHYFNAFAVKADIEVKFRRDLSQVSTPRLAKGAAF